MNNKQVSAPRFSSLRTPWMMNINLATLGWLAVTAGSMGSANAATVFINFDSVSVPAGQSVDATSYLASFGIGFVPITSGASPAIFNTTGLVFSAVSPPNVFAANGPAGVTTLSYELTFSQLLTSFSFVRVGQSNTTTLEGYTISALDGLGNVLSSESEPRQFGGAAVSFTLNGPGIAAIRMDASGASSTVTDPPLDNFSLVTPNVPEPGAFLMCGAGLLALGFLRLLRAPRAPRVAAG